MARPQDSRWSAPAAWLAAALAFLSKGLDPRPCCLPGCGSWGSRSLFPEAAQRRPRACSHLVGIALLALLPSPRRGSSAMQKRRPDFYHVFFYEQHFQRYLTAKYNRGAPWWFYLAGSFRAEWACCLWTAPFLAGMWRAVQEALRPRRLPRPGARLLHGTLGVAGVLLLHVALQARDLRAARWNFRTLACFRSRLSTKGLPPWGGLLPARVRLPLGRGRRAGAGPRSPGGLLPSGVWPPGRGLPLPRRLPRSALLAVLWIATLAAAAAPVFAVVEASRRGASRGRSARGIFLFLGLEPRLRRSSAR